jgi:hypothetical protein
MNLDRLILLEASHAAGDAFSSAEANPDSRATPSAHTTRFCLSYQQPIYNSTNSCLK